MCSNHRIRRFAFGAVVLLLAQAGDAQGRRRPRKEAAAKLIRTDTIKVGAIGVLRSGPGDSFKASDELPAGASVEVIALKGRWAQVRIGRKRGWLLRRVLTGYQPTFEGNSGQAMPQVERVWGGQGTNTSFQVQVASKDAVLRSEAREDAAKIGDAAHGTTLVVVARSADREWVQVRNAEGAVGWISNELVQSRTMANVDGDDWSGSVAGNGASLATRWRRSDLPRLQVIAAIGIGYRSISMDFSSLGEGVLANTITDSQAMAAETNVDLVWRTLGRRVFIGIDGRFRTSYAKPGIEVLREDMSLGNVDFSAHESAGGLRAGIVIGDLALAARVGGRYDVFLTRSVDNVGLLPRESLSAGVVGARLDWYRLAPEVVLSIRGEMVVAGRHKQTAGLEDGETIQIRGGAGEIQARYRAADSIDVIANFHYGWSRYTWTGRSARNPDVMESERRDNAQSLGLGLGYRF